MAIRRCYKAGFTALDFNYWDYQEYVLGLSWEEEKVWAQHIRSVADEVSIEFSQMHGPVHGANYVEMVLDLDEESYYALAERSIRTAAILGVPWVVFHATKVAPENESPRKRLAHSVKFYKKLFPVMEQTGVGIALENLVDMEQRQDGVPRRNYCSEQYELIELIDTLNHPLVGVCWDTGHANMQGLDQKTAIQDLGKRVKVLHINDNNGKQDQHLLPFQGSVNWKKVMDALAVIKYEGDFTFEAHRSIKTLPDQLRDAGLQYGVSVARYLIDKI